MLGIIAILFLLMLLIPLRTVEVSLRVSQTAQSISTGESKGHLSRLVSRTKLGRFIKNRKKSKTAESEDEKLNQFKQKVSQITLFTVKKAVKTIRMLIVLVGSMSFMIFLIVFASAFILITSLVSVACFIDDTGEQKFVSQFIDNSKDSETTTNDGSMISCVEQMAKWYLANVPTYQGTTSGEGTNSRTNYPCNLLKDNAPVGDDCSGFASAVINLCTGQTSFLTNSDGFTFDKNVQAKLESLGYQKIDATTIEVSDLQAGDLLCRHRHVEFYVSPTETFGWGAVQKAYPLNNASSKSGGGIYIGYGDPYPVIWRKVK